MQENLSDLYTRLYPEAFRIVLGSVRRLPQVDRQETAHDITVDFLYSGSFRNTFDGSEDLSPFFNSYVRRKCRGVVARGNMDNRVLSLSSAYQDVLCVDSYPQVLEAVEEIFQQLHFLSNRKYISFKEKKIIDLKELYLAVLRSTTEFGLVRHSFLKQMMDCDKSVLKGALTRMRCLLKKREKAWHTKS